jgi:hypothetical protein
MIEQHAYAARWNRTQEIKENRNDRHTRLDTAVSRLPRFPAR